MKYTEIVNLTPHTITICDAEGNQIREIPASGQVARVSAKTVPAGEIAGIPVTETEYGDVVGLPDQQPGTVYIVSAMVAARCKGRQDVFVPAEQVRDEAGRIVGCKSLGRP